MAGRHIRDFLFFLFLYYIIMKVEGNDVKGLEKGIIFILVLMALGSVAFALPNVAFDTSTPANATWRNGTLGQSLVLINVTSNETIHLNASTFAEWYNATNASTNVTVITAQTVNWSGSLSQNWTYWRFNLSNDGVHRFVVRVYSANSSTANAPIERYVYYDNTTPLANITSPNNGQNFLDTVIDGSVNITLNYLGTDATSNDTCRFSVDNGTASLLAGCRSITFLTTYGLHSLNVSINDSAGNMNSSYLVFRANFSGSSGGGGGGVSRPLGQPLVPEAPAVVAQQPSGIHSIAGTGPIGAVGDAVTNFINGIINWIRGLFGLQAVAVQQPQQPASIIQPSDKPSGLFGIWKDY